MFSSLPSASKIYQSSVKPRQKSASSAKKRRKKAHSSSNQHASILDDSVVSLVSCDQESSISVINGQKDLFDKSCRHSYERENSSPEISIYSVETCEVNSRSYKSILEEENHTSTLCKSKEKNNRKLSVDLCSEQNEVLSEQLNENEPNNLNESSMEDNSKVSDSALMDEKLQEEFEGELSPETVPTDSNQQNLSCGKDSHEDVKYDLMSQKDISEMTFEEVEASIEYESLKESLETVQMNEIIDESIIHSENLGSNASLQPSENQHSINQNNTDISNVDDARNVHDIVCNEDSGTTSHVENATQSPHFDICCVESSNDTKDVTCVKHEESVDSSTVANSEPHMDIVLADVNGNCLSDNDIPSSKENIIYCTNNDSCDSKDQNIEYSIVEENGGPIKGHIEFTVRTESPEQSELSCTESVLCESKDSHQEILHPEKTFSDCTDKSEDFILTSEKPKEDFNMKGSSNISQSFSNLLSEDSQTVVSSRCSSVPEGLHLSKKFVDKHSQSTVLTVLDKATLTTDLGHEGSSEECLSERNSSNEESQNESCEHQLSRSEDKGSLWHVLPPLAMVKARSRSYVFGSKGPTGSLLGSDELSRFFPDNQVTVFVGTWNMNGHDPPQSIDDFLLPLAINTLPDIYAIGVQESMQSRLEWEVLLQTTLGPSHVLFTSTSLGVLHLCIFLRRDLIWFCSGRWRVSPK